VAFQARVSGFLLLVIIVCMQLLWSFTARPFKGLVCSYVSLIYGKRIHEYIKFMVGFRQSFDMALKRRKKITSKK